MGPFRAGTGQHRKKKTSLSFPLSLLAGADPVMTSEQMGIKTWSMCLSVILPVSVNLDVNTAAMLEELVLRCHYKVKIDSHQVPVFSVKQSVTTCGDIPGRK